MSISVAMAVCNGEKYIEQQLNSIIRNLHKEDEIIISYNESDDDTLEMIQDASRQLPLIKIFSCAEKGVISNYENAIRHCTKDYIFLADQDDVWTENKVKTVMNCFHDTGAILVMHDSQYTDEELNETNLTTFQDFNVKKGFLNNLLNNSYDGCCLAFHKDLVKMINPIPRDIVRHDQWIGLMAEKVGRVYFCDKKLLQHRRYQEEKTDKMSFKEIFRTSFEVTKRCQEQFSYANYLRGKWKNNENKESI